MNLEQQLRKYLVMGSQDCDRDPLSILDEAVAAGITAFQFREKERDPFKGIKNISWQQRCRSGVKLPVFYLS